MIMMPYDLNLPSLQVRTPPAPVEARCGSMPGSLRRLRRAAVGTQRTSLQACQEERDFQRSPVDLPSRVVTSCPSLNADVAHTSL